MTFSLFIHNFNRSYFGFVRTGHSSRKTKRPSVNPKSFQKVQKAVRNLSKIKISLGSFIQACPRRHHSQLFGHVAIHLKNKDHSPLTQKSSMKLVSKFLKYYFLMKSPSKAWHLKAHTSYEAFPCFFVSSSPRVRPTFLCLHFA